MFRRWLPGPFEPLPPRRGQAFTTDDDVVPTTIEAMEERDAVHVQHVQEIARLKADCEHLQKESIAEKKQAQHDLSRARERLSVLETEVVQLQATLQEQRDELLASSKAYEELQSQNRELTNTVLQLREENVSLLVENRDLQESLERARHQAAGSMERAEDELHRTRTTLATLETELAQVNKERSAQEQAHMEQLSRLEGQQEEFLACSKAYEQLQSSQNRELVTKMSQLRHDNESLLVENRRLQDSLDRAKEQAAGSMERAGDELNRTRTTVVSLETELVQVNKALEERDAAHASHLQEIARLKGDCEHLLYLQREANAEKKQTQQELSRARERLYVLETEAVQFQTTLQERSAAEQAHMEQLTRFEEQHEEFLACSKAYEELQAQNRELTATVLQLRQENVSLLVENRGLQEQAEGSMERADDELHRARATLANLETELVQVNKERSAAEQAHMEQLTRLEEQKEEFLACSKAYNELQSQNRELTTTVLQLRQDNEALLVENHGLQEHAVGSMERADDELHRARITLAALETELVQVNKALEERDSVHAAHLQEIARLKADCEHLQVESNAERKQTQQELSRARERVSALETAAVQFEATLQERSAAEQAQIEQLTRLEGQQEEFLACSRAYDELQSQNRELTATVLQLRQDNESLLVQNRGLQENLESAKELAAGSMERADDELNRARTALATLEMELEQVNKERSAVEQAHTEQLARSEEQQEEFLACSKAHEELQSQNQELNTTVVQLRQDNESLLVENHALQESLESAKEQATGSMERADDELNRAQTTLATLETELVQVNKALEERDAVHASHLQEIARLKADCEHLQEESKAEREQTQQDLGRARERLSVLETEAVQFQATLQERNAAEQAHIEQLTRLEEQQEEFLSCSRAYEELQSQNRELTITVLQLRQDNESLLVENRGLQESVALFEEDLEKVSDRNAQLLGHTNPKQKIRYTLKLKEEKMQLRAELNRLRSRVLQLEGTKHCDSLFEALVGDASSITAH